jgi:vacuolar-type H+-ATPase subunit H
MAQQAADQVRGIVEAAERSASEITEGADDEARKIVDDASNRARDTREKADRDALDRVQAAEDSTQGVLDRANAVKAEIDRMLDDARAAADTLAGSLRGSASSLQSELDAIRGELSSVREGRLESQPRGGGRASSSAVDTVGMGAAVDRSSSDDDSGPVDAEPEVIAEVEEEIVVVGANGDTADSDYDDDTADDVAEATEEEPAAGGRSIRGAEGARLIALNMALNGTPRDETARYLSQNFDLDDQDALLDEVYARVGD